MEYIKQNLSTIIIFTILIGYLLYQRIPIYFANKQLEEKQISNLKFKTLDGEIIHFENIKDKPILINFWATWCMPCKIEMPILESLHQDMKNELILLGIANEKKEIVESYLKDKNINYTIVIDESMQLAEYFNIQAYPTLIYIKNGVIKDVSTGFNPFLKWKIKWFVRKSLF